LVEQAERCRVQLEDGEDQGHGSEGFLAAREQVDVADALTGRSRHDGDARHQQIVAIELQIGMPAAEEAREYAAQPLIGTIERFLEARPRLSIYLANGALEGLERLAQILELRIQVLLPLQLLLVLVDGREVDRPQPLNSPLQSLE